MCFREIQLGLKWRRGKGFACGLQGQFLKRCWATDRSRSKWAQAHTQEVRAEHQETFFHFEGE